MTWQLQEAKNKFSEVVNKAITEGPQEVSKRGKKAVVILSITEYNKLKRKSGSLVDFFRSSPLSELDLSRNKDLPRDIEL